MNKESKDGLIPQIKQNELNQPEYIMDVKTVTSWIGTTGGNITTTSIDPFWTNVSPSYPVMPSTGYSQVVYSQFDNMPSNIPGLHIFKYELPEQDIRYVLAKDADKTGLICLWSQKISQEKEVRLIKEIEPIELIKILVNEDMNKLMEDLKDLV